MKEGIWVQENAYLVLRECGWMREQEWEMALPAHLRLVDHLEGVCRGRDAPSGARTGSADSSA